jgi:hypothetical protein
VNSPLFMSRKNKFQVLIVIKEIEDIQYDPTRVAKNILYPFPLEAFDDDLGSRHFHWLLPLFAAKVSMNMNYYDIIFMITFPER